MSTITWKNADLSGRRFLFEIENQEIGTLTLLTELSSNANFSTTHGNLQFKRVGFWYNKILLKKNDVLIGEIVNRILGPAFLKLKGGNQYRLSSNLFGRNLKWLNMSGQPIAEYFYATMKSRGKGFIHTPDSLPLEEMEILMSSGFVAGRFNAYRLSIFFLLLCSALFMISKAFLN